MDSATSGSMQSSSTGGGGGGGGGDEEYDSRAESAISAFLNSNPTSHVGPMPNPPQPPSSSSSSSVFDPLSNYFNTNTNSPLSLDMVWPKTLRSDPNLNDLCGLISSSSSTPTFQMTQQQQQQQNVSSSNDRNNNNNNVVRNPKKRSRASRRAPTTVLTTDTTNFRAMVQEFTGIPAPPFTSSHFPRSRLDLFGTAASAARSAAHLDVSSSPPYLLRPFAQKIQPPPFASSAPSSSLFPGSSLVEATNTSSTSSSLGFQIPTDLGLLKQPQNLMNMNLQQNSALNIQSLLQAPPKTPILNFSPSDHSQLKMGVLEDPFGASHGQIDTLLGGLQNIVSGVGSNDADRGGLLRSINGGYSNSQGVNTTNGKLNYPASSSDFHGEKGTENVAARSEGMVESWICSSD